MPTLHSESATPRIARSAADIRAWIVGELVRSLNVKPSAIDTAAPLDSFGVDSLVAMGTTGALAQWLSRDLPATLMWDYLSIDAIADGLADRDAQAAGPAGPDVVNLQPRGNLRPLFFFPGQGGHPVTFAALASHLGPMQPCFGLTVPGLNEKEKPQTRVEDIAAAMLQTIRRLQPKGPYQLAGYSFGGLLAYETAQQLVALGETVSTLAIYDTFTPAGRTVRPLWQRLALHAYLLATHTGRWQYLRERLERRQAMAKMAEENIAPAGGDTAHMANAAAVETANAQAVANYRPRPYPGSVLLFRATRRAMHSIFYKMDPCCGWGALARGGVRTFDLPGTHLNILSADNVPVAAAMLRPHLAANAPP